jgi:protein subunit release factor B
MSQPQQLFQGDASPAPVDATVPIDSLSDPPVKQKIKIVLDESDLEERFVRATGNGGQKVNKSSSKVVLVHRPTGLITSCQDARDLSTNRRIARKLMVADAALILFVDDAS